MWEGVEYNRRSFRDDNKKAGNCYGKDESNGKCKCNGNEVAGAGLRDGSRIGKSGGEFYFSFGLEAEPWTMRSLSTLKAPGAELACIPAMEESIWLRTTP
jgi:hypothetical protein